MGEHKGESKSAEAFSPPPADTKTYVSRAHLDAHADPDRPVCDPDDHGEGRDCQHEACRDVHVDRGRPACVRDEDDVVQAVLVASRAPVTSISDNVGKEGRFQYRAN